MFPEFKDSIEKILEESIPLEYILELFEIERSNANSVLAEQISLDESLWEEWLIGDRLHEYFV